MRFTLILLALVLHLAVLSDAKDGKRRGKKRKGKDEAEKGKDGQDDGSFQHAKLSSHLIKRYREMNVEGAARPVTNTSETLKVKFGLNLNDILDVDKTSDIVILSMWETYQWDDAFLSWDPADYDGINDVRLPIDEIYKPDIILYNSVAPQELMYKSQAVVASDGSVQYFSPTLTKLRCTRTAVQGWAQYFKKDNPTFTCKLKYGSWVNDGFKLDLDFYGNKKMDITNFDGENMYTIETNTAEKHVVFYACCPEPFPDLTFDLVFKELE